MGRFHPANPRHRQCRATRHHHRPRQSAPHHRTPLPPQRRQRLRIRRTPEHRRYHHRSLRRPLHRRHRLHLPHNHLARRRPLHRRQPQPRHLRRSLAVRRQPPRSRPVHRFPRQQRRNHHPHSPPPMARRHPLVPLRTSMGTPHRQRRTLAHHRRCRILRRARLGPALHMVRFPSARRLSRQRWPARHHQPAHRCQHHRRLFFLSNHRLPQPDRIRSPGPAFMAQPQSRHRSHHRHRRRSRHMAPPDLRRKLRRLRHQNPHTHHHRVRPRRVPPVGLHTRRRIRRIPLPRPHHRPRLQRTSGPSRTGLARPQRIRPRRHFLHHRLQRDLRTQPGPIRNHQRHQPHHQHRRLARLRLPQQSGHLLLLQRPVESPLNPHTWPDHPRPRHRQQQPSRRLLRRRLPLGHQQPGMGPHRRRR